MTVRDVEADVLNGGRFVVFAYNFSLLIMSFKRSSGITYLRSDRDGAGSAFGYSLLSLLVGPWGFPWGLIWTPASIFTNLRGGKDVTQPILEAYLGSQRAAQIMASRRKPSAGWGLILVRTLFISAPLALAAFLWMGASIANRAAAEASKSPGYAEYQNAHSSTSGSLASGNTQEARTIARNIASGMKEFLDAATTSTGTRKPSHDCGVWCELRNDRCIVVMRVPDLRHYDSDAKQTLAEAAWLDSEACLHQAHSLPEGAKLLVAVRGEALYDSVMTGKVSADPDSKPDAKFGSSDARSKLIEWFKPETATTALTKPSA